MPVVWATAHITQFTKIGWRYLLNEAGSGTLYNDFDIIFTISRAFLSSCY